MTDDPRPSKATSVQWVCMTCEAPAKYVESERVWRHAGEPFEDASGFCEHYGYPINVKAPPRTGSDQIRRELYANLLREHDAWARIAHTFETECDAWKRRAVDLETTAAEAERMRDESDEKLRQNEAELTRWRAETAKWNKAWHEQREFTGKAWWEGHRTALNKSDTRRTFAAGYKAHMFKKADDDSGIDGAYEKWAARCAGDTSQDYGGSPARKAAAEQLEHDMGLAAERVTSDATRVVECIRTCIERRPATQGLDDHIKDLQAILGSEPRPSEATPVAEVSDTYNAVEWWKPYVDFVHAVATSEHSEGCSATDEDEEDCECFYAGAKDLVMDHPAPGGRYTEARQEVESRLEARLDDDDR